MTYLSFRCFNGYREARLNYEFMITRFKAVFLNIIFTVMLRYICQLKHYIIQQMHKYIIHRYN